MAGGNAIRGSRVGAGPMGEAERGEAAPRTFVSFWCSNGHETRPSFAQEPGLALPEQRAPHAPGRDPGVRERLLLMGRLIHRTVTHGSV